MNDSSRRRPSAQQDDVDDPLDVKDIYAAITVRIGPGQNRWPALKAEDDVHDKLDVQYVDPAILVDIFGAARRQRGGGRQRRRRR